jgi:hypothetical protein
VIFFEWGTFVTATTATNDNNSCQLIYVTGMEPHGMVVGSHVASTYRLSKEVDTASPAHRPPPLDDRFRWRRVDSPAQHGMNDAS